MFFAVAFITDPASLPSNHFPIKKMFPLQYVSNPPQEEEALLSEMDVTGQAFEDMQEQNSRLLQQLREKDDANFKLMSERIKSNQIYKLLKEEKEELADQVLTFKTQVTRALRPCLFSPRPGRRSVER